jgi:hypothetical protein
MRTLSSPKRTPLHRRGITLFSILLSLCAVGLFALVAIPIYFARHDVTLDNACKLLLRDLRAAQSRASLLKDEAVFAFDADGWRATTHDGERLTRHGTSDAIERRLSKDAVFDGVRVENIDFGGASELRFDERGQAQVGGQLEIVFRGQRRYVSIEKGTGLAVVLDEAGEVVAGDPFHVNLPGR